MTVIEVVEQLLKVPLGAEVVCSTPNGEEHSSWSIEYSEKYNEVTIEFED